MMSTPDLARLGLSTDTSLPRLFHYSHMPIKQIEERRQIEGKDRVFGKPEGLWLSVGDAWARWCESERFSGGWQHVYEVVLKPEANILHLATHDQLNVLTEIFGHSPLGESIGRPDAYISPDWAVLAHVWDGILISPYIWSARLEILWYYGWDVASGCLWNPRAIESWHEVVITDVPREEGEDSVLSAAETEREESTPPVLSAAV